MEISHIWLMTQENDIVVLAEVEGKWYEVIRTFGPLDEMTISHCVNVRKMPTGATLVDFDKATGHDQPNP